MISKNKRIILFFAMACVFFLGGCNMTGKNTTTKTKKTTAVKQEAKKYNLTAALDNLESNSEDIMDDIIKANWKKADDKVKKIKSNMDTIKKSYKSAHIPKDFITNLDNVAIALGKEVSAKNKLESQVGANLITKYIPDITDLDKQPVPTDVMRLDYLGREISLNAQKKDYTSATDNLTTTKFIWTNVKSKMSSANNKDISSIDSMIINLEKSIAAKDSAAIIKNSNIFLDGVDTLETDFIKQSK